MSTQDWGVNRGSRHQAGREWREGRMVQLGHSSQTVDVEGHTGEDSSVHNTTQAELSVGRVRDQMGLLEEEEGWA